MWYASGLPEIAVRKLFPRGWLENLSDGRVEMGACARGKDCWDDKLAVLFIRLRFCRSATGSLEGMEPSHGRFQRPGWRAGRLRVLGHVHLCFRACEAIVSGRSRWWWRESIE